MGAGLKILSSWSLHAQYMPYAYQMQIKAALEIEFNICKKKNTQHKF